MSYVGLCSNGHITGYKKCGTCGEPRGTDGIGTGKVLVPKHKLDRSQSEVWKARCATASTSGTQGPNKVANFST